MRVDFEVSGADSAARDLIEIGERAADARPVLKAVQRVMAEGLKRNFESKGSHFGEPWEGNRPGTLARKARMGQGGETMVATGAARDSLTGGRGKRSRLSRSSTSVGSSVWYLRFAQSGTKYQPRRPVVGFADADKARSIRMVERYVIDGVLW